MLFPGEIDELAYPFVYLITPLAINWVDVSNKCMYWLFWTCTSPKWIPHCIESTPLKDENAHCKYGSVFDNCDTPLMNLASALVFLYCPYVFCTPFSVFDTPAVFICRSPILWEHDSYPAGVDYPKKLLPLYKKRSNLCNFCLHDVY